MLFNSRGQAFDVFKLLIAAVIAVTLLGILIPIMQNLGIIVISDPVKEAATLVKNNFSYPAQYTEKKGVTFSRNMSLNSKAIASQSEAGLEPEQICLDRGDFANDATTFSPPNTVANITTVTYLGSQLKATIGVLCDDGKSMANAIAANDLTSVATEYTTTCTNLSSSQNTYCLVILRKGVR